MESGKNRNLITTYLQKKTRKVKWKILKNIYNTHVYSIPILCMSVIREFKEFAMKGNVVDLAVGVVIGGAFGKIVTSLVEDIIMPTIGKLTGGLDFSNMYYAFGNAATTGMSLADAKNT